MTTSQSLAKTIHQEMMDICGVSLTLDTLEAHISSAIAPLEKQNANLTIERDLARNAYVERDTALMRSTSENVELHIAVKKLQSDNQKLISKVYMPGSWHCDTCGFEQYNRILHVADGAVSAPSIEEVVTCPNDGSVMRKITWEESSHANYDACQRLLNERKAPTVPYL